MTGGKPFFSQKRQQLKSNVFQVTTAVLCSLLTQISFADERLESLLDGTDVTPAISGLQITLIDNGAVSHRFAKGLVGGPDGRPTAINHDHKIRVASISKLVVAIGVMRLAEQERVDLDADVSDYLGWTLRNPNHRAQEITLRQLLSHTSSIRDAGEYFIPAGKGELRDFFEPNSEFWRDGAHWASRHEAPGAYFEYANLNFGVIAEVIEHVSGQRFDHFMR